MVYVDSAFIKYRGMLMCHMLADSEFELLEMAKNINVDLKWHQFKGTYKSHFDICKQKREIAIKLGAKIINKRELALFLKNKKIVK